MPLLALLNKSDKLKQGARIAVHRAVTRQLPDAEIGEVIPFSAASGLGRWTPKRSGALLAGRTDAVGACITTARDPNTQSPAP